MVRHGGTLTGAGAAIHRAVDGGAPMRERRSDDRGIMMSTLRIAAGAALTTLAMLLSAPLLAATAARDTGARHGASASTDFSAQVRVVRPRPRTRIIVRPLRSDTGIYPSPAPYNYPGPNAVRECEANYVQEFRPSGTVIVPRMHCWWEIPR
jgi:hypothetical protein